VNESFPGFDDVLAGFVARLRIASGCLPAENLVAGSGIRNGSAHTIPIQDRTTPFPGKIYLLSGCPIRWIVPTMKQIPGIETPGNFQMCRH
jgi:hypothetical protein